MKLYELQKNYNALLNCMETLPEQSLDELSRRAASVQEELRDDEQSLKRLSSASKQPLVAELAGLQLEYYSRLNSIIHENREEMEPAGCAALGAEYLMDFAMYAVRQARLATLNAACLQRESEENHE